jgi:hypothetical protein
MKNQNSVITGNRQEAPSKGGLSTCHR